ncbi:MAG: cytochrome C [Alphaproteobacteria bacterium]|nr:MAG: cytochrome C [Alphaproteobacteria bacterium]
MSAGWLGAIALVCVSCLAGLGAGGAAGAEGDTSLSATAPEAFRVFEGHGGPVTALAVSPDGRWLATGSFDTSVGLWPLDAAAPPRWIEGHAAAVNAVAFCGPGLVASAGDDAEIRVNAVPDGGLRAVLRGHVGKIVDLAAAPDGRHLASAGWDGTARLWDIGTGREILGIEAHPTGVNAVAFGPDGRTLLTAGKDGILAEWRLRDGARLRTLAREGFGINRLLVFGSPPLLAYGTVDGATRVLSLSDGALRADLSLDRRPILALAADRGASHLAVGDGEGFVMIVRTSDWRIRHDFHAAKRGPVWALAFTPSGGGIIAGGMSHRAYLWPLGAPDRLRQAEGEADEAEPADNGERLFLRKCSICHTLGTEWRRRAGPPLGGLFGRRAGTAPGYGYSDALRRSDLVWTDETVDALFREGPDVVTPGSKMPIQRITSARDRADLIRFLRQATATREAERKGE